MPCPFNDAVKNCFNQFGMRMATSDLFHMFTQSIKFYTLPLSHTKEYRCLKKVIHQIYSKNEWLLLSASFMAKFGLVCLNIGIHFFLEFSL